VTTQSEIGQALVGPHATEVELVHQGGAGAGVEGVPVSQHGMGRAIADQLAFRVAELPVMAVAGRLSG